MLDCIFHTNIEDILGVITWELIVWGGANMAIGIVMVVWHWHLSIHMLPHSIAISLFQFAGYCGSHWREHASRPLVYQWLQLPDDTSATATEQSNFPTQHVFGAYPHLD